MNVWELKSILRNVSCIIITDIYSSVCVNASDVFACCVVFIIQFCLYLANLTVEQPMDCFHYCNVVVDW